MSEACTEQFNKWVVVVHVLVVVSIVHITLSAKSPKDRNHTSQNIVNFLDPKLWFISWLWCSGSDYRINQSIDQSIKQDSINLFEPNYWTSSYAGASRSLESNRKTPYAHKGSNRKLLSQLKLPATWQSPWPILLSPHHPAFSGFF